eukprot:m.440748 g.440748  ORF g.440748 m.440748 type:complete len:399 (-) comp18558_c0_seq1:1086-2282(-)
MAAAGTTFKVNKVAPSAEAKKLPKMAKGTWAKPHFPVKKEAPPTEGVARFARAKTVGVGKLISPDSCTEHPDLLEKQAHGHGFIAAVATAFDQHLPLSLRPEHFWLLVLQAVSRHVNANAEALRHKFVNHEGKETLEVRRDDFSPGRVGLDWAGVVTEIGEQINGKTVPGVAEMVSTDFSTTTPIEQVAAQVTVMDMLQSFFEYKMSTCCGFPSITLEGAPEDWHNLRAKTTALVSQVCTEDFAASWIPALLSVLDRFVAQVDSPKEVDVQFWQSFCKRGGMHGSGGYTWLNGWFNVFFPDLKQSKNSYCVPYSPDIGYAQEKLGENYYSHFGGAKPPPGAHGPDLTDLPGGMASAPVTWDFLGTDIPLTFTAGFAGAAQRADGTVAPEIGWLICANP